MWLIDIITFFYFNTIFYFLTLFTILYFSMSFILLPKVLNVLKLRKQWLSFIFTNFVKRWTSHIFWGLYIVAFLYISSFWTTVFADSWLFSSIEFNFGNYSISLSEFWDRMTKKYYVYPEALSQSIQDVGSYYDATIAAYYGDDINTEEFVAISLGRVVENPKLPELVPYPLEGPFDSKTIYSVKEVRVPGRPTGVRYIEAVGNLISPITVNTSKFLAENVDAAYTNAQVGYSTSAEVREQAVLVRPLVNTSEDMPTSRMLFLESSKKKIIKSIAESEYKYVSRSVSINSNFLSRILFSVINPILDVFYPLPVNTFVSKAASGVFDDLVLESYKATQENLLGNETSLSTEEIIDKYGTNVSTWPKPVKRAIRERLAYRWTEFAKDKHSLEYKEVTKVITCDSGALGNLNSVDSDTEKGIQTVDEAIKLCEDAIKKNEIKRPDKADILFDEYYPIAEDSIRAKNIRNAFVKKIAPEFSKLNFEKLDEEWTLLFLDANSYTNLSANKAVAHEQIVDKLVSTKHTLSDKINLNDKFISGQKKKAISVLQKYAISAKSPRVKFTLREDAYQEYLNYSSNKAELGSLSTYKSGTMIASIPRTTLAVNDRALNIHILSAKDHVKASVEHIFTRAVASLDEDCREFVNQAQSSYVVAPSQVIAANICGVSMRSPLLAIDRVLLPGFFIKNNDETIKMLCHAYTNCNVVGYKQFIKKAISAIGNVNNNSSSVVIKPIAMADSYAMSTYIVHNNIKTNCPAITIHRCSPDADVGGHYEYRTVFSKLPSAKDSVWNSSPDRVANIPLKHPASLLTSNNFPEPIDRIIKPQYYQPSVPAWVNVFRDAFADIVKETFKFLHYTPSGVTFAGGGDGEILEKFNKIVEDSFKQNVEGKLSWLWGLNCTSEPKSSAASAAVDLTTNYSNAAKEVFAETFKADSASILDDCKKLRDATVSHVTFAVSTALGDDGLFSYISALNSVKATFADFIQQFKHIISMTSGRNLEQFYTETVATKVLADSKCLVICLDGIAAASAQITLDNQFVAVGIDEAGRLIMNARTFNRVFHEFGLGDAPFLNRSIQLNNYFKDIRDPVEYRRFQYTAHMIRDFGGMAYPGVWAYAAGVGIREELFPEFNVLR